MPYVPRIASFDKVFATVSEMTDIVEKCPGEHFRQLAYEGLFFLGLTFQHRPVVDGKIQKAREAVLIGDEAAIFLALFERERVCTTFQRIGNGIVFKCGELESSYVFSNILRRFREDELLFREGIGVLAEEPVRLLADARRATAITTIERYGNRAYSSVVIDYALEKYTGYSFRENLRSWRDFSAIMAMVTCNWREFPKYRDLWARGFDIFFQKMFNCQKMYDRPFQEELNAVFLVSCCRMELIMKTEFGDRALHGRRCRDFSTITGAIVARFVDEEKTHTKSRAALFGKPHEDSAVAKLMLDMITTNADEEEQKDRRKFLFTRCGASMLSRIDAREMLGESREFMIKALKVYGEAYPLRPTAQVGSGGTPSSSRDKGGLNGEKGALVRAGIASGRLVSDLISKPLTVIDELKEGIQNGELKEEQVEDVLGESCGGVDDYLLRVPEVHAGKPDIYVGNDIVAPDGKPRYVPMTSFKYTQESIEKNWRAGMLWMSAFEGREGRNVAKAYENMLNTVDLQGFPVVASVEADLTNATYEANNAIPASMTECMEIAMEDQDDLPPMIYESWRSMSRPSVMIDRKKGYRTAPLESERPVRERNLPGRPGVIDFGLMTEAVSFVETLVDKRRMSEARKKAVLGTLYTLADCLTTENSYCVQAKAGTGKTLSSILLSMGLYALSGKRVTIPLTTRDSLETTGVGLFGRGLRKKSDDVKVDDDAMYDDMTESDSESESESEVSEEDSDDDEDDIKERREKMLNMSPYDAMNYILQSHGLNKVHVGFRHRYVGKKDRKGEVVLTTSVSYEGMVEREEVTPEDLVIIDEVEGNKRALMITEAKKIPYIGMSATPSVGLFPASMTHGAPSERKGTDPGVETPGTLKEAIIAMMGYTVNVKAKVVVMCNSIKKTQIAHGIVKKLLVSKKYRVLYTHGSAEGNIDILKEQPADGEVLVIVTTTQVER